MSAGTEHLFARARATKGFMPDAEGEALYRAAKVALAAAQNRAAFSAAKGAAPYPAPVAPAVPAAGPAPPSPPAVSAAVSAAGSAAPAPPALAASRAAGPATPAGPVPLGPLLEIGTYCGKSALYLAAAARESATVLFSVDHHHGSEENQVGWDHHDPAVVDAATGRMDTLPWARRTIEQAGLETTVVLVVGPSEVVAAHWSTPLSLLFIDGGHGRDVAWGDYRAWSPKVAPGGFLALHDVFPDPADGGRPPYELFCQAVASGEFGDCPELACGSLRVLRRMPVPANSW